ncbi:glycosyltransferase family 4 protein [Gammaproteobacteria bacterium]|nr:glycosyltransferase family 4 protein [Gammaproteobacteria bacterium]MDB4242865.1 glycosyltransferase family 4 protein [Gammaproteobacteria bacterium]
MTTINKKKLYIVSEFVDEKTNSTGYFWFKIINGLSEKLEDINVISLDQSCQKAVYQNNKVVYLPVKGSKSSVSGGFARKLLDNIVLSFKFSFKILRFVRSKAVVFSGTNPSMLVLFIAVLRPLIRFRWVLLVNDIFPENLAPAQLLTSESFIFKITKYLFDFAYSRADRIIVIGRDMQKLVDKKTNNRSRTRYIPNWVDLDDISVASKNTYQPFSQMSFEDKVVFQFFGNMGAVQGLDILLAAIAKTKNTKAKFVFIGSGLGIDLVNEFIKKNPFLDVELHPPISFKDNNIGLNACDIAMVSLAPGMSGLAVPSKAYFSLAADKPIFVIGDLDAELDLLLKENEGIGWYCSSYSSGDIAKMLDNICDQDLTKYRNKPRSIIKDNYSYHSSIAQYLKVLNELG